MKIDIGEIISSIQQSETSFANELNAYVTSLIEAYEKSPSEARTNALEALIRTGVISNK